MRQNPADKRLAFVWPSLDNEQKLTVLDVVFNAIGIDHWRQELDFEPDDGDEVFGHFADKLSANTIVDAYIPWLAKVVKRGLTRSEEDALKRRFRSICIWAKETNTDLGRVSLADALENASSHVTFAGRKGKVESDANPVVYRFDDGFKIVQLKTDAALELEGKLLKHCVGTYCDQVREGTSVIYSLRTPSNEPLVTLEYQPRAKRFMQMFGLENEAPEPSEQPYLIEFVETNFPDDKMGLLMAGKPAKDIDLEGANLTGADLTDANLRGANLAGAYLIDAYLGNADLTGANLSGADLEGAHLEDAQLEGADLEDAHLRGANLAGANLAGANLAGANLAGANLEGAHLEGANLAGAYLIDADLRGAHLEGADLEGADLEGANLTGADLTGENLAGANLGNAYLGGANLTGANLTGANFGNANLKGAYLERANLKGAKLVGANLEGVKYDDDTIWPAGFTPPPPARENPIRRRLRR